MPQNDLWYFPYTLTTSQQAQTYGALLRINDGFGAIHPWIQFGDLPLDQQLASIKNDIPTQLAKRSLYYIDIDRDARQKGISLFQDFKKFKSHKLFISIDSINLENINNLETVKIKISNSNNYIENLNKLSGIDNLKIRLDANCKFSFDEFCNFWDSLNQYVKTKIEFVEDPCPYDDKTWATLAGNKNVPIAYDFYGNNQIKDYYKYRVIKPVVQKFEDVIFDEIKRGVNICITSSLDHPLGVCIAAWEYNKLNKNHPGSLVTPGLTSFTNYQKDIFSEIIWDSNDQFKSPNGTGFGFDDLLDKLQWQKL
jgi:O-succinylbenzoate synthase